MPDRVTRFTLTVLEDKESHQRAVATLYMVIVVRLGLRSAQRNRGRLKVTRPTANLYHLSWNAVIRVATHVGSYCGASARLHRRVVVNLRPRVKLLLKEAACKWTWRERGTNPRPVSERGGADFHSVASPSIALGESPGVSFTRWVDGLQGNRSPRGCGRTPAGLTADSSTTVHRVDSLRVSRKRVRRL